MDSDYGRMKCMARPKDQERRRAEVIRAATEIVTERGADGLRLKDISERVGLAPASILYYYRDVSDILAAVFEDSARVYCDYRQRVVDDADGHWSKLTACVRAGVLTPGRSRQAARALFELFPLTLRHERMGQLEREFIHAQRNLYIRVLEAGQEAGVFQLIGDARSLARSFVALEDGYGIDQLSGTDTTEEIEAALIAQAQLVTGVTESSS
jgi:AcrR family transcriptional regulator